MRDVKAIGRISSLTLVALTVVLAGAPVAGASHSPISRDRDPGKAKAVSAVDFRAAYDGAAAYTLFHIGRGNVTARLIVDKPSRRPQVRTTYLGRTSLLLDLGARGKAFFDSEGADIPLAELGLDEAQTRQVLREVRAPAATKNVVFTWSDPHTRLLISGAGYKSLAQAWGAEALRIKTAMAFDVQNAMKDMSNMSATMRNLTSQTQEWRLEGLLGTQRLPFTITFSNDRVGRLSRLTFSAKEATGATVMEWSFRDWYTTDPTRDGLPPSVPLDRVGPPAWRLVIAARMETSARAAMRDVIGSGVAVTAKHVHMAMRYYKDKPWRFEGNSRGGTYMATDRDAGKVSVGIRITNSGGRPQLVLVK